VRRLSAVGGLAGAALVAAWALPATPAAGQGPNFVATSVCAEDSPAKFHPCALAAARTAAPPKTADGRPDFGGYWRRRTAAFESLVHVSRIHRPVVGIGREIPHHLTRALE